MKINILTFKHLISAARDVTNTLIPTFTGHGTIIKNAQRL